MEDKTLCAYFIDKTFVCYVPKTFPFVSLSINFIHQKAVCVEVLECVK